jgi:SCP-2 sterol transfer family protein
MAPKDKPKVSQSSKAAGSRTMEAALLALGGRVSKAVPRAHGSIVVHCTDTGEEFALEGMGSAPRVSRGRGNGPHQVEVRGPAAVLRAVAEGRHEPARALAAGGIRVRGDLRYLEAMLKDVGLLECP